MEGHGIKAEWVEGVPGCEGATVLIVHGPSTSVSFTQGQASILLWEISKRPSLVNMAMFSPNLFKGKNSQ